MIEPGLRVLIVDPDDDYLGVEIHAASERFAGSTRIYVGLDELGSFASRIEGFPTTPKDERAYEFGSRDPGLAGGFSSVRFHCVDGSGHAAIGVTFEDDSVWYDRANADFSFRVHAADIDRFVVRLRDIEKRQSGEAVLPAAAV